jgi:cytochrome c-type biogenesis protein CcmH/NrfG
MEECRNILRFAPQDIPPRLLLGRFLLEQKKFTEGMNEFKTVLNKDPDNIQALISLSWILATDPEGNSQQKTIAVSHAFRAASLSQFQNAEVIDALAIAQASTGKFKLAINLLRQSEQHARRTRNLELLQLINEQRLYFEQEKPWTNRDRQPGMIFSSY